MTIMNVTGHRQLLPRDGITPPWPEANSEVLKHHNAIIDSLVSFCSYAYDNGIDTFITGMAIGADQLFAKAIIKLKAVCLIRLIAAIPFIGQESSWPERSKKEYKDIIELADIVEVVSPGGYTPWKMQKRNEWMVNNANLTLAIWDGFSSGGTRNCVSYALAKSKPVIRMDHRKFTYQYINKV